MTYQLSYPSLLNLNPKFIGEMFHINQTGYDLRNETILVQPKFKKVMYGYKTFSYYGSHLWNKLPINVKWDISFNTFKTLINKWDAQIVIVLCVM